MSFQKFLAYAISILLLPQIVAAKCAVFNLEENLHEIPYLAKVRINNSLWPKNCTPDTPPCFYTFTAEVLKVLKGEIPHETLTISYRYRSIRPAMILFNNGDEVILALSEVNEKAKAKLYGTKCGRWGTAASKINLITEKLSTPKE